MRRRGCSVLTAVGVSALASGCASGPPAPPGAVRPPPVEVAKPPLEETLTSAILWAAPPTPVPDEILRSPMVRHPGFREAVDRWVEFWRVGNARWFPDYLKRMAWYAPYVDSALAQAELPPSLRYLPLVESGYNARAVSHARAVGLWQFMEGTARGLGMEVSPLRDDRRDPFVATRGAVAFLKNLKKRFGSWFLALAAYNAGPGRVERLLNRHAPLAPRNDSLYWAVRRYLPRETRDFLPKFFAAVEVAENPGRFGFKPPASGEALAFDEVTVPDAATLDVVARAAEVPQEEVERLNPQIVRGITPPGRVTPLRVPAGRGPVFRVNFARIPPEERVTFVEHRVRRGETLTHIARRYGIPLRDLRAANPGIRPRYLQIGQRLTVPVAPSVRRRGAGR
ncbi:MAG: transglycosylase SLT domain-containing protein [Gemmatimonadota bacterium]